MQDLLAFLKCFYDVTYLPMTLYDQGELVASFPASSFRPDLARLAVARLIDEDRTTDITVSAQFVMAGFVRDLTSDRLLIIGPLMEFSCNRAAAYAILESIGEPPNRADELQIGRASCWVRV